MPLLRILLLGCPPRFRRHYGQEMLELCDARRRRLIANGAQPRELVRFWVRTIADVTMTAAAEWRDIASERFTTNRFEARHNTQRISMYDRLTLDIRDGFRHLGSTPGFTLAALAILALGIGRTPPSSAPSTHSSCDRDLSPGLRSWFISIRIPTMDVLNRTHTPPTATLPRRATSSPTLAR